MLITTGNYLNLTSSEMGIDIFVVFNEPNSEPTCEEIEILKNVVEEETKIHCTSCPETLDCVIQDAINRTKCECVMFGVQVIVRKI